MSDDMRPCPADVPARSGTEAANSAIDRLRREVAGLRHQVEGEVRTRRVVIVDEQGVERIRLSVDADGGCCVALVDVDGFERTALSADRSGGSLRISARPLGVDPARVDVFALDPEDDAGAYTGIELIEAGNSVAGFTVVESHAPRAWTAS